MTPEPTSFLYPFVDSGGRDPDALLADLARSAEEKATEARALAAATLEGYGTELDAIGEAMAGRFEAGGRLFSFGNGGSATDASGFATLFTRPPRGRPLRGWSLVSDEATLTALGNDVGFELVFSRQLIAHARPVDIAVGFSTSGSSDNVIAAFAEAKKRGLLTVGLAGYDGGRMAVCGHLDHCLVVRSDSVHRIQEATDALALTLWERVQEHLGPRAPL